MSKENKKTKEKFVNTINNENLPISKCRKYESGFYKIGDTGIENSGDCYLLKDNKYYRIETGQVVFDHRIKEYTSRNASIVEGYVNSNLEVGCFSVSNKTVEVINKQGQHTIALNKDIFSKDYYYREKLEDGVFYHIDRLEARRFNLKRIPQSDYKNQLPYDSKTVMKNYVDKYNKYEPTVKLKNDAEMTKILNGLSFGVEFETTKGFIPSNNLDNLGLIPLRDGSITGIEYVTVPLSGSKGLSNLVECISELKHRTEYDDRCALHIHLGNVPRDEMFITAFLKLTLGIQDELFSMFNLYKKYNFGYKNKNYSAPYNSFNFLSQMDSCINEKNIRSNFNLLFSHLAEGHTLEQYTNSRVKGLESVQHHHRDPTGNQKWNVKERYHVHNFIPLIFGNKTTIEFRIHTPTYNKDKILWFLMFNSILINYTKENANQILNGEIKDFSLESIIINYLSNKRLSSSFITNFIKYLRDRKKQVEDYNRKSEIHFSEDDIRSVAYYPVVKIEDIKDEDKSTIDVREISEFQQFVSERSNPYLKNHISDFDRRMYELTLKAKKSLDNKGYDSISSLDNEMRSFFNDPSQDLKTSKGLYNQVMEDSPISLQNSFYDHLADNLLKPEVLKKMKYESAKVTRVETKGGKEEPDSGDTW